MTVKIETIDKLSVVQYNVSKLYADEKHDKLYLHIEGQKLIYRLSRIHRLTIVEVS